MSTPYQIFRDAPPAPLDDDGGDEDGALEDVTLDEDAIGESIDCSGHETGDNKEEEEEKDKDKENVSPNPTTAVRPLSPNSRQIRANARRLLLQEPGERRRRRNRKARMSLPLMPNNGPLLGSDNARNIAKGASTKRGGKLSKSGGQINKSGRDESGNSFKGRYEEPMSNSNSHNNKVGRSHEFHALTSLQSELADFDIKKEVEADLDYIKQEIEADLAEIREAARSMANRAVEVSNGALGSLTGAVTGVGAGAWGMVGQLWE